MIKSRGFSFGFTETLVQISNSDFRLYPRKLLWTAIKTPPESGKRIVRNCSRFSSSSSRASLSVPGAHFGLNFFRALSEPDLENIRFGSILVF